MHHKADGPHTHTASRPDSGQTNARRISGAIHKQNRSPMRSLPVLLFILLLIGFLLFLQSLETKPNEFNRRLVP